jgi:hypothetical protein
MTDTATSWSPSDGQESTTDKAKTEAKEVGRTAVAAGGDVAQTAKEQGRQVTREAARQARDLYGTTRAQLRDQTSAQQRRAAGGIRSIGDEIRSMAEQGGQSGPASELAQQAAGRISEVAGWIEAREPGQVVDEVKQFARRHPGAFLAGAAIHRLRRVERRPDRDSRGAGRAWAVGHRDAAMTTTDTGSPADRSFGDLMGEVTRDLSTLVRQEVELAKAEIREEGKKAGKAAGMFGGAGLAGHMVLLFLSFALWWGLSNVMDQGWAALIVAVIWAVIGAVLFAVARSQARAVRGLPRTTETVKDLPPALKPDTGGY